MSPYTEYDFCDVYLAVYFFNMVCRLDKLFQKGKKYPAALGVLSSLQDPSSYTWCLEVITYKIKVEEQDITNKL